MPTSLSGWPANADPYNTAVRSTGVTARALRSCDPASAKAQIGAAYSAPLPAPFTAGFSSRGPLLAGAGDLLKPDVIAPGVNILAAVAPPGNGGESFAWIPRNSQRDSSTRKKCNPGICEDAGFLDIETRDRNSWYATLCTHELDQIEGPLKQQLIDAVGEEIYTNWLGVRRGLAQAVSGGGLRPTHLRGVKPAN